MKQPDQTPIDFSVIIPLFNDSSLIDPVYQRLVRTLTLMPLRGEIIFADDASTDGSADLIRRLQSRDDRVRGVVLRDRSGQAPAILAGLTISRGELIAFCDVDMQCPPEELPRLLSALTPERNAVFAFRRQRRDPVWRIIGSWIMNRVARVLTGIALRDWGCPMYCVRRGVVARLCERYGRNARFLKLIVIKEQRHASVQIGIEHAPRAGGHSRYDPGRLFRFAVDAVWHYRRRFPKAQGMLFRIKDRIIP